MSFVPGCLYKHKNNATVAFEVLKRFLVHEKMEWKLKVRWYCVSSKRAPESMGFEERVKIPHALAHQWTRMGYGDRVPAPVHVHWTPPK